MASAREVRSATDIIDELLSDKEFWRMPSHLRGAHMKQALEREGFAVVPVEPTEAMKAVREAALSDWFDNQRAGFGSFCATVWKHMLTASQEAKDNG